jgi:hypothetical protein
VSHGCTLLLYALTVRRCQGCSFKNTCSAFAKHLIRDTKDPTDYVYLYKYNIGLKVTHLVGSAAKLREFPVTVAVPHHVWLHARPGGAKTDTSSTC